LIARGGGSIVNISSTSGLVGLEDVGSIAHCATKGGVNAMTRQYAMEGAPHWIRCNTISPGPIRSPGLDLHAGAAQMRQRAMGWTLLPRLGEGEDVAYAGLFLASDESQFITGANLVVDGGMTSKSGFSQH
jgi:NAD(P)-dependent dehydrogenase (short-subunit alcohol dehydrogenase family)